MEELERLAVGQGDSPETSRDHRSPGTSRNLVWYQPTIYARILDVVSGAGQPMTRLEIARALGIKKTPWFRQALDRLVTEGELNRIEARTAWGALVWLYEVRR